MESTPERQSMGAALGKIASGLYVATAMVDGRPLGLLCSFVEQAGFAPPMISLAIAPGRPIVAALDGDGLFGLHVLSKENSGLLKAFARGDNPEAFAELAQVSNKNGVPQFADAWAFLTCQVRGKLDAGDHAIYVAEVIDGLVQQETGEPMVRIRANGFGY